VSADVSKDLAAADRGADTSLKRMLRLLSGYVPDELPPAIVRLDYEPRDIHLYVTSKVERNTRVRSCQKEPWTVRWIEQHVTPGSVVYDIGANVGAYALIAAHHTGPTGRVVAIEPSYATFAHLCDNVVLNELSDIVIPVPLALGAVTARTRLHYNALTPGHARHSLDDQTPAPRTDRKIRASLHALATSLDDLIDLFELPAPHYMKIDVDGTELDVLRGAVRLLASPVLQSVMIEVENVHTDEIVGLFATAGFSVRERYQRTAEDGTPADWWFGVFTRGDASAPAAQGMS
jgi:FkbM family methyltransferase